MILCQFLYETRRAHYVEMFIRLGPPEPEHGQLRARSADGRDHFRIRI